MGRGTHQRASLPSDRPRVFWSGSGVNPKLGFVGLGNIGSPLCERLIARGYDLQVYDVNTQAMERFRETSAGLAPSLTELAGSVDVVILSLPDSAIVEKVVLGEGGLAEGLAAGKVLIDLSSSRPSSTQRIAEFLNEKSVYMLDAPVSGGVLRARKGELAIMVGGDKEVFDRHREILRSFGDQIFHVGAQGTGHLAKALNNLLSATTLASAAEAILLGARVGLDPEKLIEVINASSGRSNSTEVKFPSYILNHAFDDGFAISLMNKDVKIALDAASDIEQPMFIGSMVAQVWQAAADEYGERGHTEIYTFLENLSARSAQKEDTGS